MRVDVWSDIVCPWCYIGQRRFERALAGFAHREDVDIVHRSFQLNPSFPRGETSPRRAALMRKYGLSERQAQEMDEKMEATAAAEGLEYHLGGGLTGNTFDAHQLLHLARDRGVQGAVAERFFRAYFTEGRSIFDPESLIALASETGLDAEESRRALAAATYADAVAADLAEANAIGVTGVPFFVLDGRYAVSGAQPADLFRTALDRTWTESHPEPGTDGRPD